MHKVLDGQRRRVQICMGLHPYKVVPMTFLVHVRGKICWNPKRCWDWSVGSIMFLDARDVTWYNLQENLEVHGYRRKADLYFLIPGSTPPDGLGLILGEEQVRIMKEMHQGRKKMRDCHLYIVKKPRPGSYDSGYYSSSSEEDGMDDETNKYNPTD